MVAALLGLLLAPLLAGLLAHGATPAPATPLERARWEVRYLGVTVGHVDASTERRGEAWVTTGAARSAPWYRPIYDLDDAVTSTWVPVSGSLRYQARFREGRFHQDQDQRFGPDALEVTFHQRKRGEWVTWTDRHDPSPGAFDPVAAIQSVRALEGDGPWELPVFSGRATRPLRVTLVGTEQLDHNLLGPVSLRVLDLQTDHRGELEQAGRFRVWVTDDPRSLLVRAVVLTNLGAVRVELIESELAPAGRAADAAIPRP